MRCHVARWLLPRRRHVALRLLPRWRHVALWTLLRPAIVPGGNLRRTRLLLVGCCAVVGSRCVRAASTLIHITLRLLWRTGRSLIHIGPAAVDPLRTCALRSLLWSTPTIVLRSTLRLRLRRALRLRLRSTLRLRLRCTLWLRLRRALWRGYIAPILTDSVSSCSAGHP